MGGASHAVTGDCWAGWVPARIFRAGDQLRVDWCHLGDLRFTDPFFEQTITRALRDPATILFRRETSLDELEAASSGGLDPSAFVFHLSRCGSTLVSQMLAALPRNIVISEAPPIDRVIQSGIDERVSRAQQITWLRGLIRSLGRPRTGETRLFIKLDSWHILQLPLLQAAFPSTPWIFLYRDPVEVMVSHARMRGSQMIPHLIDPRRLSLDPAVASTTNLDEYTARVLGRLCEAALEFSRTRNGSLVNYVELPAAVSGRLAPIFGPFTSEDHTTMHDAARMHAKEPTIPFVEDAAEKQGAATSEIRQLAERWIAGPFAKLEALRTARTGP
jgi:hypothetical protein